MDKQALVLHGGWPGHYPKMIADFAISAFLDGFSVQLSDELEVLTAIDLRKFDVILPIWTLGKLSVNEELALLNAVEAGVGIAAWHGIADGFNENHLFKFVLGGQFICHPGDFVEYKIDILKPEDPLVKGLSSFNVISEQYFMHVDPNNNVLATTTFEGHRYAWLKGQICPAIWTRNWGKGRVFYQSVGHTVEELSIPEVLEITRRGVLWATRNSSGEEDARAHGGNN